jgi:hypothetical protein
MNPSQNSNWKPTRPQWSLVFKRGTDAKWNKVGAGWDTARGGISIHLDANPIAQDALKTLSAGLGKLALFVADEPQLVQDKSQTSAQPPVQPDYMDRKRAERCTPLTAKPLEEFGKGLDEKEDW